MGMEMSSFQKLRLQEFNDFDLERILKENIDKLELETGDLISFITEFQDSAPVELIENSAISAQNNAGEVMYVTSILHHDDDIYSYFTGGPLFRKDREVR